MMPIVVWIRSCTRTGAAPASYQHRCFIKGGTSSRNRLRLGAFPQRKSVRGTVRDGQAVRRARRAVGAVCLTHNRRRKDHRLVPGNMSHPGSDIGQFTSGRGAVNRKSAERDLVPILPLLAADTSDEED